MTVADEIPGRRVKLRRTQTSPGGGAYKSQDLTDAGEPTPGVNKFERIKAEKDGLVLKQELDYL